jgi:hypothetical protein
MFEDLHRVHKQMQEALKSALDDSNRWAKEANDRYNAVLKAIGRIGPGLPTVNPNLFAMGEEVHEQVREVLKSALDDSNRWAKEANDRYNAMLKAINHFHIGIPTVDNKDTGKLLKYILMTEKHCKPDHPILKQVDDLLNQLAIDEAPVTDHDIEYVDGLADILIAWVGTHIDGEIETAEESGRWEEYIKSIVYEAAERRN